MWSEVNKLNRIGFPVSRYAIESQIESYKGIIAEANMEFYNMCFSSSPAFFNKAEIVRALNQSYPDYAKLFISQIDGVVNLTSDVCAYVLCVAKHETSDKELVDFLTQLHRLLKAQEALDVLKVYSTNCSFGGKTRAKSVCRVIPRLDASKGIVDHSKMMCDSDFVRDIILPHKNCHYYRVSYAKYRRLRALSMLGVTTSEYKAHAKTGKGYFDNRVSASEELQFLELYLTGSVIPSGAFSERLQKRLAGDMQYSLNKSGMSVMQSFYEKVLVQSQDSINKVVGNTRKKLASTFPFVRALHIGKSDMIFEFGECATPEREEAKFSVPSVFRGTYICAYHPQSGVYADLPMYCMLDGNYGEYVTHDVMMCNHYYTEATEVKIGVYDMVGGKLKKSVISCYNIADVHYTGEKNSMGGYATKTLTPIVGSEFNLIPNTEEELLQEYGVSTRQQLYRKIRSQVTESMFSIPDTQIVGYLDLLTELICAFKYFKYLMMPYQRVNDNYAFVTEDLYHMASYEANRIYEQM